MINKMFELIKNSKREKMKKIIPLIAILISVLVVGCASKQPMVVASNNKESTNDIDLSKGRLIAVYKYSIDIQRQITETLRMRITSDFKKNDYTHTQRATIHKPTIKQLTSDCIYKNYSTREIDYFIVKECTKEAKKTYANIDKTWNNFGGYKELVHMGNPEKNVTNFYFRLHGSPKVKTNVNLSLFIVKDDDNILIFARDKNFYKTKSIKAYREFYTIFENSILKALADNSFIKPMKVKNYQVSSSIINLNTMLSMQILE